MLEDSAEARLFQDSHVDADRGAGGARPSPVPAAGHEVSCKSSIRLGRRAARPRWGPLAQDHPVVLALKSHKAALVATGQ